MSCYERITSKWKKIFEREDKESNARKFDIDKESIFRQKLDSLKESV